MVAAEKKMSIDGIASRKMLEQAYEEKKVTVNNNVYEFTNMTHKERRTVFAFLSSVSKDLEKSNLGFLDTAAFEKVEKIIEESTTFNGMQISKIPNHWDDHLPDYIRFMIAAMGVMSYPFTSG